MIHTIHEQDQDRPTLNGSERLVDDDEDHEDRDPLFGRFEVDKILSGSDSDEHEISFRSCRLSLKLLLSF
ncbi:hypothetical protein DERF_004788 [Dermatophagoides farinae]|uniref:Uncharacterized protein n=1 Tax=Dermatophagoides farinae TaxID=6954 RepID=A0A922L826_DERFA|nr:hypothetical protein DERF_004788 [Dermatophagoides farinae]